MIDAVQTSVGLAQFRFQPLALRDVLDNRDGIIGVARRVPQQLDRRIRPDVPENLPCARDRGGDRPDRRSLRVGREYRGLEYLVSPDTVRTGPSVAGADVSVGEIRPALARHMCEVFGLAVRTAERAELLENLESFEQEMAVSA